MQFLWARIHQAELMRPIIELSLFPSRQHQFSQAPAKGQLPAGDGHGKDGPAFRLVTPPLRGALAFRAWNGCLPKQFGHVLGRAYLADRHAEELVARVAILPDGGIVDVKEGQGFPVENPHWI